MHINWKGAKEFFSDCSFNFNHPHMSVHRQRETQLKKTLYMETFPLGHMKSMRSTPVCACVCARVCVWETQVVLLWGRQHERPWQFQISCCRWIFINNICQWNIPSLCLCVCVCVCVCLTILPLGHPECADSKRIAHQYSCEFMLSLMLQQIVSDQTHSLYLRPHECISQTEREKKKCVCVLEWKRGGELSEGEIETGRTKGGLETATDGLMFPADEKETLKNEQKRSYRWGEKERGKKQGVKRRRRRREERWKEEKRREEKF